ncbi:MAG: ABC transporter ATP-binding protein, partial [Longimicrobiales bacterium]
MARTMHAVPAMIRFENVTKRYGAARRHGTAALRDVSLSVPRGGAYSVVGPNGAGKSTLFALTLGFLRPTTGTIIVDEAAPRDYVRRHGAGYLPERFGPPAAWRVRDALHAFARIDGEPAARADAALERWGLTEHATKELGELSHGLRQRVGLAQALLAPRELVMLDEPHEGLDPLWRVRLREAVLELRAEGRTIVIASHDLAEVERMTEHAVLLDDGQVREVLETAAPATPTRYRIRLAAPSEGFAAAFSLGQVVDGECGSR